MEKLSISKIDFDRGISCLQGQFYRQFCSEGHEDFLEATSLALIEKADWSNHHAEAENFWVQTSRLDH